MRYLFIFTTAIVLIICGANVLRAQNKLKKQEMKTEEIKVNGLCDMCKDRIEKAAKVDGVTVATWDKKTKMLKLTYDPAKINLKTIETKIAAVGHDTPNVKADAAVYAALPACCHYRE